MKHVLFTLLLLTLFPSGAQAAQLPGHMEGMCIFTFKSSVEPAQSLEGARAYMKDLKDKGFTCAIIKSHDGDNWGTIMNGKFKPAFSKHLVDAGHELGMRVYSYFTARLNHDSVIEESVNLAERTLNMGADGVVIDDLALGNVTGSDPKKWRKAFPLLREMVNKHKGAILASSTHPHLSANGSFPVLWGIAFSYSDYFLPQEYWMEFVAYKDGKRVKMTPQDALAYGQAQFDVVKTRYPDAKDCKLVPIGRTYGEHTTAKEIETFIKTATPFYKGLGLFVIEQEPKKGGWAAIKDAVLAAKPGRTVEPISPYDQFHNSPKSKDKKPGKEKSRNEKKPEKEKAEPKPAQPHSNKKYKAFGPQ